jgi:hypothetical protein
LPDSHRKPSRKPGEADMLENKLIGLLPVTTIMGMKRQEGTNIMALLHILRKEGAGSITGFET